MAVRTLGPYRIDRRIATGGMAEVFVAHRQGPHGWQKRVALKCILPQLAKDPEFLHMFIDEARLAARLEHPAIVPVFDFGEVDGTLFLAMELVDGASVSRLLRAASARNEPIPLPAVLHVGIEAARGLAYAHHARDENNTPLGVVHRDVSPANVLCSRRGQPKLGDFGIARFVHSAHRTDEGHVRGKLGYMSPEQVAGTKIDGRSDVFTLATVLAEMLIGAPLFGVGTDLDILLRIRNADIGPLTDSAVKLPVDVREALAWALTRRPGERPEASQLADRLETIARRRGVLGIGAAELSRLLHRLELVEAQQEDLEAREPGARPTSLVSTSEVRQPTTRGSEELLARLAVTPPTTWEIKRADGTVVGPVGFAELVRRIIVGEVDGRTAIRREGEAFEVGDRVPELARYLTSPALAFRDEELETASVMGSVEDGSLLSHVTAILGKRMSGLVLLREGAKRKKIYFVDGRPDFVASNLPHELLGEYLVRSGACLRMEVDMALAMLPKFSGRLGDALVGLGVLKPAELYTAVTSQVRTRYLEAFRWRHGQWAWVAGARAGEESFPLREAAADLIRDAARATDFAIVTAGLDPLRERVLVREPDPILSAGVFGLPEPWTRALGAVNGKTTLSNLVLAETAGGRQDPEEVYRAIWFGITTGLLRAA